MNSQVRSASLLATLALLASTLVLFSPPAANGSSFTPRNGVCETAAFSGTGTQSDPYEISTADQLAEVGDCGSTTSTNYSTPYAGNPTTAIPLFVLVSDIDLAGTNWIPLIRPGATSSERETKVWMDGQGHSITGLTISSSSGTIGLFSSLVGAHISNLEIYGEIESTGASSVGTLAGFARESTFSNLVVRTSISADVNATRVGGLVGYARGNLVDRVRLGALSQDSKIVASANATVNAGLGGLLGTDDINYLRPWGISNSIVKIDLVSTGQLKTGGLVGDVTSNYGFSILNSHFIGNLNGTHMTGGLAGRLFSNSSTDPITVASSSARVGMSASGFLGGLVGVAYGVSSTDKILIRDSFASGSLTKVQDSESDLGGLVGANWLGSGGASIEGSFFDGQISGQSATATRFGGLIGRAEFYSIQGSGARGEILVETPTLAVIGGLAGDLRAQTGQSILSHSYAVISYSSAAISANKVRGIANNLNGSGHVNTNLYFDQAVGGGIASTNVTAGAIDTSQEAQFVNWEIDPFSQRPTTLKPWIMCQSPVPSRIVSPPSCELSPQFAVLSLDGLGIDVYFNRDLVQLPEASAFSVNGGSSALSLSTVSARILSISLSSAIPGGEPVSLGYTKPGSSPLATSGTFGPEASTFTAFEVINGSALTGPVVSNLAASSISPTSFEVSLECGGSCDPSANYTYFASITPAGGATTNRTSTANGTATLLFNNLNPNVAHAISVTVTQGGLTSPAATLNVTTPKPAATISAFTIADTSATLTVGCTNCGAAPDSFTVSATPVAGGAAITSNTNVISGLTSETTYSFSVVVEFAGTTSDVVLWQDNPVMTLPFVPIISAISPAAVPLSGGTITVTGSNFTTSSLLTLGGTSSAFTIVSGTEITFTAPSGTAGSFDLAITNPVGTFTLSNAITYVSGPTLTSNSPVLATTNGGTIVTLMGTDLATTNQVNVGSTTVSFSVVSNTVVRFTTAATTAGVVDVGVVTVGGPATISNAIEFTTSALVPVVSTITPVTGPTAGGTTITVTGQYFSGSYSDSVSAAINGVSGSSVILIDDSTLTFVSPAGAAATGLDVTVGTGGGVGTLAGAFSYTAPPAPPIPGSAPAVVINTPTITEFSTREISATGGEVTATGLRLENISLLTLGGITVTIVSSTATSLTFTTGEMPVGVWDLRLVGSNGTLVFQQAIEVVEATAIVGESTGELLGYTWTLKFIGNSRTLHLAQEQQLARRLNPNAETIICWGYTTASSPNAWAIAHATQRAQAACDFALANQSNVKTIVRLRYGVSKDYAMRSALQFWK